MLYPFSYFRLNWEYTIHSRYANLKHLQLFEEEGQPIEADHSSDNGEWQAVCFSDQFVDVQSNGTVHLGDDTEEFLSKMLRVNLFAYDYTGYGMAYDQGKQK